MAARRIKQKQNDEKRTHHRFTGLPPPWLPRSVPSDPLPPLSLYYSNCPTTGSSLMLESYYDYSLLLLLALYSSYSLVVESRERVD